MALDLDDGMMVSQKPWKTIGKRAFDDTMRNEWVSKSFQIFLKITGRRFFDFSLFLAEKLTQGPI